MIEYSVVQYYTGCVEYAVLTALPRIVRLSTYDCPSEI